MATELINCGKNVKVLCKVYPNVCLQHFTMCASSPQLHVLKRMQNCGSLISRCCVLRSIISGDRETGWEALAAKQVRNDEAHLAWGSDRTGRTQWTYMLFRKKN